MDVVAPNTEFSFKNAENSDIDFMHKEILAGASKGHFSESFLTPKGSNGLKLNLTSIVGAKRRLDSDKPAYGVIYHRQGAPVGFIINSSIQGKTGTEIWMMGISENYQGQGHGAALLDEILRHFSDYNGVIMARCHPASQKMYQMLINRGFKHETTGEHGTRFLVR
ncbi:GNAT family N-acetyltransferase [Pseudomonas sp. 905_Psudmo1]|nr:MULTISPECIES: GNAT family N-acetyltransferase [Pseudomonas]WFS17197.1 GNAT family N-acetyltransferase [Pseudomonas sp. 905_Psudmo1]